MHGVTHQYKGVSTDDAEFWNMTANQPIVGENVEDFSKKIELGLNEFYKNNLFPIAWETPHYMALYYIFFFAIIISDILFVLSLLSIITIPLPGPYSVIWVMAIVLFMFEITLAISFDKEDTPRNIALILIMYFTYCQLWIFIMELL